VATHLFLQHGYTSSSIAIVAQSARVSTRTIYEQFTNKAGLWNAVVTRLMLRNMEVAFAEGYCRALAPREALIAIGEVIFGHVCTPEVAMLYRILATGARKFPALAAGIRRDTKAKLTNAVLDFLYRENHRSTLIVADPARDSALFVQMVCAEVCDTLLFGSIEQMEHFDSKAHLEFVVDIFLNGTAVHDAARH
jgi:AcrR family transcriptional regulator